MIEGGYHVLVFKAEPGPVLTADVTFPGATVLSPKDAARRRGRRAEPDHAPARRGGGHPAPPTARRSTWWPRWGPRAWSRKAGVVRIAVPVEEGPEAKVVAVKFVGATLPEDELVKIAALPTGGRYDPDRGRRGRAAAARPLPHARASRRARQSARRAGRSRPRRRLRHQGGDRPDDRPRRDPRPPAHARAPRARAAHGARSRASRSIRASSPTPSAGCATSAIFRRAVVTASPDPVAAITVELEEARAVQRRLRRPLQRAGRGSARRSTARSRTSSGAPSPSARACRPDATSARAASRCTCLPSGGWAT